MSLINLLVEFVIGLGSLSTDKYLGGPKFALSYVSGHPNFRPPDEKGRLVIARDSLKYATGSSDSIVFEISMDRVAIARPLDPDMVEIQVIDPDGNTTDIYFRSRKPKEVRRFLAPLAPRLRGASASG